MVLSADLNNDDGHLHSLNYVASTPATCSDDGNIEYWYCADCGKYFSDAEGNSEIIDKTSVVVAATGHDWGEWTETKAATCTENGLEQRECTACHEIESDLIEATGHDWGEWTETEAATCTENGIEQRECVACHEIETDLIEATGHDWVSGRKQRPRPARKTGLSSANVLNATKSKPIL